MVAFEYAPQTAGITRIIDRYSGFQYRFVLFEIIVAMNSIVRFKLFLHVSY